MTVLSSPSFRALPSREDCLMAACINHVVRAVQMGAAAAMPASAGEFINTDTRVRLR